MIGELSILSEWIPEQMEPGTIFVLENAGEVGEKEDPYWAVLVLSLVRTAWAGHAQTGWRIDPRHLRIGALFRPVLHSRRTDHAAKAELKQHRLWAQSNFKRRHGFGCAFFSWTIRNHSSLFIVAPHFRLGPVPRYTLRPPAFLVNLRTIPVTPPRGQGQRTVNRNASSVSFSNRYRLRRRPARDDGTCAGQLGSASGMDQPA